MCGSINVFTSSTYIDQSTFFTSSPLLGSSRHPFLGKGQSRPFASGQARSSTYIDQSTFFIARLENLHHETPGVHSSTYIDQSTFSPVASAFGFIKASVFGQGPIKAFRIWASAPCIDPAAGRPWVRIAAGGSKFWRRGFFHQGRRGVATVTSDVAVGRLAHEARLPARPAGLRPFRARRMGSALP